MKKRDRDSDAQGHEDVSNVSTTNFRNVSACNRCRTRKNRCDQKLPRCTGCERAGVSCLGYDPVSKTAIPRSYVYYLETRVRSLESLLQEHNVAVPPPEDHFPISDAIQPGHNVPFPVLDEDPHNAGANVMHDDPGQSVDPALRQQDESRAKLEVLTNDVGMVSVQGTTNPRLAPISGISFARVVFAAVKASDKGSRRTSKAGQDDRAGGSSMGDSFFGLHTKPSIKPAPFPDLEVGHRLVELYFEYANPQLPILHRLEFEGLIQRIYATDARKRTARELYLSNIVFAIGSGIIMDSATNSNGLFSSHSNTAFSPPQHKRQRLDKHHYRPEEYHSASVMHLENFLASSPAAEGRGGGLEELQAVLLLASLALLRPVAPGLWYIVGVAVRLAIDLGLHSEEVDPELDRYVMDDTKASKAIGRKQSQRDFKRRLWWCAYSFDRLVSTCVGRPFGVSDQVITTEFPSVLEDKYITSDGFLKPPHVEEMPSYKLVARHYFRLRLLQSEILQVLQYRQAENARLLGANRDNDYVHKDLFSPFLHRHGSFRAWRADVDQRLLQWKESTPEQAHTGVSFTPLFFELNYYQAIVMLYRQSLAVPEELAQMSPITGDRVQSPGSIDREAREDEELVFMKVAQAGQMCLKIYRQLHRLRLVNYTYLAVHHLFLSGVSFLYAIWHSPLVRSQLTVDDVDLSVLSATSVLGDLAANCPPAAACRDAFARMSKATIAMVEASAAGFGTQSTLSAQRLQSPQENRSESYFAADAQRQFKRKTTLPKFDMNLKDLFDDRESPAQPPDITAVQTDIAGQEYSYPVALDRQMTASSTSYSDMQVSPVASYGDRQDMDMGLSNQKPYMPLAQTISQSQPDFTFDDMSFLDSFPVSDPTGGSWGDWGGGTADMGMGFGTGGTGSYDMNGNWDPSIDLFGGLFFGNDAGGAF